MDFLDIVNVIILVVVALAVICISAFVVWAIWFECTRTIGPKPISDLHCSDDSDDWDDCYSVKRNPCGDQCRAFQREQERQDMENHDRIVSDALRYAEYDCMTAMHICEQDNDICHHANDLHNDMFSGGGNPFF